MVSDFGWLGVLGYVNNCADTPADEQITAIHENMQGTGVTMFLMEKVLSDGRKKDTHFR
jgi:hypothetical protein